MKAHKMKEMICPSCGTTLDGALAVDGADEDVPPCPGDLSLCIYCNAGLSFDDDLNLRLATMEEVNILWEALCEEKANEKPT